MSVQVLPALTEDCHLAIEPVLPLRPTVVDEPLHRAETPAVAVPLTEGASTVTVAALELADEQTPLVTTARNSVVCVRLPVESGLDAEAISVQVVPLLMEDCHFAIDPVWPLRLIVVDDPLQTSELAGAALPPTDAESTVTVAALELADEQTPLVTTARNCVVWVRVPVLSGLAVEVMSDHVPPPLTEDCHLAMEPVWPLNVIVVVEPLHSSDAPGEAVPPAEATSIATDAEPVEEQPLVTVTFRVTDPLDPAVQVT
jgi:hypothetical protein